MRLRAQHTAPRLALLSLGIAALLSWVGLQARQANERARRFAGFDRVVSTVQAGQLKPAPPGVLRLPKEWAWLSADGNVYQLNDPTAGRVLLFPTERRLLRVNWGAHTERKIQIAGYLHCMSRLATNASFEFQGGTE